MEQAPHGVSPWEYKLVEMGNPLREGAEERANAFGQLGWELVTVDAGVWIFKRPHRAMAEQETLRAIVEHTVPLVEAEEPTAA